MSDKDELGFAGLFEGFEVGSYYHMLSMYGNKDFDCDDEYYDAPLESFYRTEKYKLTFKANDQMTFVSVFHERGAIQKDARKIRYEFDLESGFVKHYPLHKPKGSLKYKMRQGFQVIKDNQLCVWISTDKKLTKFNDTRLKTLHESFKKGMLIVPVGNLEFEDL